MFICFALHCIALHCTVLRCIVLYSVPLHRIALHCIVLSCRRYSWTPYIMSSLKGFSIVPGIILACVALSFCFAFGFHPINAIPSHYFFFLILCKRTSIFFPRMCYFAFDYPLNVSIMERFSLEFRTHINFDFCKWFILWLLLNTVACYSLARVPGFLSSFA